MIIFYDLLLEDGFRLIASTSFLYDLIAKHNGFCKIEEYVNGIFFLHNQASFDVSLFLANPDIGWGLRYLRYMLAEKSAMLMIDTMRLSAVIVPFAIALKLQFPMFLMF
jgi:hypothetical protein